MHVQVQVNFGNTLDVHLSDLSCNEIANVSDYARVTTKTSNGYKGFQLSPDNDTKVSTLDGNYALYPSTGYPGILSRSLSDENGNFVNRPHISFTLRGHNFKYLYIEFDQTNKEYATAFALVINNAYMRMTNDRVFRLIDLSTYAQNTSEINVEIEILEWSKPHASAKITHIACTYEATFTGNMLEKFTCSENATNSEASIQPGIVEQYANASLYDRYDQLHVLAENEQLLSGADVNITVEGVEVDNVVLGTYKVSNWDISTDNRYVKLSASDPSIDFGKIKISSIFPQNRSLHDMLVLLFGYVKNYSWKYANKNTQYYCESVITPNNWFASEYLDKLLQKICTAGMLRIYWYNDSFIVMRCF